MKNFLKHLFSIILTIACCSSIIAQSFDAYITDSSKNSFVKIADVSNSLTSPIDLDFYPNQTSSKMELWVLNQGTNSTGGSTLIVTNPHKSTRSYKYIKDGNAWHFMALASAMAFGDSNWATSQDILDANRSSGRYTGPTLWSGNQSIYGIVGNPASQEFNGSHLSMVHQGPYGKGIAFEKENVYWFMDGYDGLIKRFDFGTPHQPGGDDHSGGSVRVFTDFSFTRHTSLPSHIVIDKDKKYLYGCDPVEKRIFRVDITTGNYVSNRTKLNNEPLTGYFTYTGLQNETVVNTGLSAPVGVDIFNNRLIVTDNGTKEIIIYDISSTIKEIGRISLNYSLSPDIMGIKVGPDGKIYFVDKSNKAAYMINNSSVPSVGINEFLPSSFTLYPNPINDVLTINSEIEIDRIEISNLLGEKIFYKDVLKEKLIQLNTTNLKEGIYIISISANGNTYTKKLMK